MNKPTRTNNSILPFLKWRFDLVYEAKYYFENYIEDIKKTGGMKMNAIVMYRIERWLYLHHLTLLAKIVRGGYTCYTTVLFPILVK